MFNSNLIYKLKSAKCKTYRKPCFSLTAVGNSAPASPVPWLKWKVQVSAQVRAAGA